MAFIDTFNPENYMLLGEGMWGKVYDLNDGTVLKIAKEKGGVGSGRAKVLHEIKILKGLELVKGAMSFGISEVIGSGDLPKGWMLKDEEYAIWMRSTKVAGTVLEIKQIEAMNERDQEKIAGSLARAMVEFHKGLRAANIELQPDKISIDPETAAGMSDKDLKRFEITRAYIMQDQRPLKPIHGDFNISNIMFGADLAVSGVLDFAETCQGHDEDDICSLTSELPFLKAPIIREYETLTGQTIDPVSMMRAEMKRNLISLIICRYKKNWPDDAQRAEQSLDCLMQQTPGFHI